MFSRVFQPLIDSNKIHPRKQPERMKLPSLSAVVLKIKIMVLNYNFWMLNKIQFSSSNQILKKTCDRRENKKQSERNRSAQINCLIFRISNLWLIGDYTLCLCLWCWDSVPCGGNWSAVKTGWHTHKTCAKTVPLQNYVQPETDRLIRVCASSCYYYYYSLGMRLCAPQFFKIFPHFSTTLIIISLWLGSVCTCTDTCAC